MYETVELDWLARLVPFTTSTHLETVVIETAHSNGIQVLLSCAWEERVVGSSAASDGCLVRLIHLVM